MLFSTVAEMITSCGISASIYAKAQSDFERERGLSGVWAYF